MSDAVAGPVHKSRISHEGQIRRRSMAWYVQKSGAEDLPRLARQPSICRATMMVARAAGSVDHDGSTTNAVGGVHAPGWHPYRVVALSGRRARRQLQPEAPDPLRAEAGGGALRRLVHGRPSGRPQHADGGIEAQRDGDLVRPVDPACRCWRCTPSISASSPPPPPPSSRPTRSPGALPRSTTSATGAPGGTSSPPPTPTRRSISG